MDISFLSLLISPLQELARAREKGRSQGMEGTSRLPENSGISPTGSSP